MDTTLLNSIRTSYGFSRSVAYLISVALIALVVERTIYYALLENDVIEKENVVEKINRIAPHKARLLGLPETKTQQQRQKEKSNDTKLSEAVVSVQDTLDVLAFNLMNKGDANKAQDKLEQLYSDLQKYDEKAITDFAKTEAHIEKHQLADVIKQRHIDMVENYQNEMKALLGNLKTIQSTDNTDSKLEAVLAARKQLEEKQLKRSPQPFDPNNLPNKSLKPNKNNIPRTTAEQFVQAGMVNNPLPEYAALGDFNYSTLPSATNPAYLSETVEVKITQAIKDQAAALNYDAVKIYHWVRNNVVWIPSWGAMQDADITLGSLRGNSADIASLLVALLRASQIPARYVHGTIDVPSDKFMNWVGGFSSIDGAANYAASGGIPLVGMLEAGKIANIRMEHIWVEAAADYFPSRAAVNRDADSWIELDASYKQYEYFKGLDVAAITNLDKNSVTADFLNSGEVNEAEGWFSGLNPNVLQNAKNQVQTTLINHINTNFPSATVGDVIGGNKTIINDAPGLPSSLPNPIIIKGARYAQLSGSIQPTIQFSLGRDVLNQPISATTLPWAKVNNQKVTLSFKPASKSDEEALASLFPEGQLADVSQLPTTISAYLISVIPEIKLNGAVISSGNAMSLGEEVDLSYKITLPTHGAHNFYSPVVAGSYVSIATIGGSVSVSKLNNLKQNLTNLKTVLEAQDPTQLATINRKSLLGNMFYAGTLGYFAQYTAQSQISGMQQGTYQGLMPSVGTYGYVPKVNYFFGFPQSISPGGIEMDLDSVSTFTGTKTNNQTQLVEFVKETGMLSSTLEHVVPEQMFTSPGSNIQAVSAMKVLALANSQGQRTYHITQQNQSTAIPNINHDSSSMNEIKNALALGKEVITHTDSISVNGWSGSGYIILDSETGEGAYKISGGLNGGFTVLEGVGVVIGLFLMAIIAAFLILLLTVLIYVALTLVIGLIATYFAQLLLLVGLAFDVSTFNDNINTLMDACSGEEFITGVILISLFSVLAGTAGATVFGGLLGFIYGLFFASTALTRATDTYAENNCS